eukprot:6371875-Amphidinium_carterae.2
MAKKHPCNTLALLHTYFQVQHLKHHGHAGLGRPQSGQIFGILKQMKSDFEEAPTIDKGLGTLHPLLT